MGIFSKLFGRKNETEGTPKKGVEDCMSFIRIYLQACMAANLGITNIRMVPELAEFKRVLKIQTINNKLGVAEKAKAARLRTGMRPPAPCKFTQTPLVYMFFPQK